MSCMRLVQRKFLALISAILYSIFLLGTHSASAVDPTPAPTTSPTPVSASSSGASNAPITPLGNKPARKIFTGWIPYYSVRAGVARAIAYKEMINEVSPFWYSLTGSKTIKNQFTSANPSLKMAEQVQLLRSQGMKVIPALTDGTKKLVLSGYLAKESSRKEVVSTITKLVVTNNFDGIDLDLEGFAFVDGTSSWSKTKPLWTTFITELSASLHANNKLLSVTTPVLFDPASGRKGSYSVYNGRNRTIYRSPSDHDVRLLSW